MPNENWKCQSCGKLIDHNPMGTAAICAECGGTSKLQQTTKPTMIEEKIKEILNRAVDKQGWLTSGFSIDTTPYVRQLSQLFEAECQKLLLNIGADLREFLYKKADKEGLVNKYDINDWWQALKKREGIK